MLSSPVLDLAVHRQAGCLRRVPHDHHVQDPLLLRRGGKAREGGVWRCEEGLSWDYGGRRDRQAVPM